MRRRENSAVGRLATELGDLLAVAGYAALASLLILAGLVDGPLRVLLAAPLLGFCPGYAVVSAVLPRTTPLPWSDGPGPRWLHRAALGLATSLVVLVLAGVALSPAGFATSTLLGTVLAITAIGCLVGVLGRLRAPTVARPTLPIDRLVADAREATTRAPRADAALNVALAAAIVIGVGTLAVGLAAPDRGEDYSEVALVTEDGERTPLGDDSYVRGEAAATTLEVENQDNADQSYTAVVVLERFADSPEGSETATIPPMLERAVLTRTTLSAQDGETTTRRIAFTPTLLGDDLRLSVYVYVGDAPEAPSPGSADYHLYRWIDVTDGTGNGTAALGADGVEVTPTGATVGGLTTTEG
jgi:uncharacterized membrane protein